MDIKISPAASDLKVKILGVITENDGDSLNQAFEQITNSSEQTVKIDLSQVPSITSTGIGKIIILFRKLKSQSRNLVINAIHDNLYALFTSINLHKMLTIEKS